VIHKIYVTRGDKGLINLLKEERLHFYSQLSNYNGIPQDLKFSKNFSSLNGLIKLNDSPEAFKACRLFNTILSLSKSILLPIEISTTSITDIPQGSAEVNDDIIKGFWKDLRLAKEFDKQRSKRYFRNYPRFKNFFFTTKAGPNGRAFFTWLDDLKGLSEAMKEHISVVGGQTLRTIIEDWDKMLSIHPTSVGLNPYTRKVVGIQAPEGKTREIAILDYWSQNSLKPLHDYIFNILKTINQDCTFDQASFLQKIDFKTKEFNSIDLKSATDRFPIKLISKVLSYHLGSQFVKSWEAIMVGTPFWCPNINNFINYSVGNPMGAYSSWASFALTHHFVVYWACKNVGLEWRTAEYVLLGDDIVINNNIIAKEYKRLLSQLGVEVSINKTHESSTFLEFAKRQVFLGTEISSFPLPAILTNYNHIPMMISDLMFINNKGWTFDIMKFIEHFALRTIKQRSKIKVKLLEWSSVFNWTQLAYGKSTITNVVKPAFIEVGLEDWFNNLPDNCQEYTSFQIIRNSVNNLLSETDLGSFINTQESDKGLSHNEFGFSALSHMLYWMDIYYKVGAKTPLQRLIPITSVTISLEDIIDKLNNDALVFERTDGSIAWSILWNIGVLPLKEKMFHANNKHKRIAFGMSLYRQYKEFIQLINNLGVLSDFEDNNNKLSTVERNAFTKRKL